jgi:hypothetical protein
MSRGIGDGSLEEPFHGAQQLAGLCES